MRLSVFYEKLVEVVCGTTYVKVTLSSELASFIARSCSCLKNYAKM